MSDDGYIRVSNFSDCMDISIHDFEKQSHVRSLNLYFDSFDKEALFFDALNVFNPAAFVDGKISTKDYYKGKWEDLMKRFELSLKEATKYFPMLNRLNAEYEDAIFSADEVSLLHAECLGIRLTTKHAKALETLDKLIVACKEALKVELGLFFGSD